MAIPCCLVCRTIANRLHSCHFDGFPVGACWGSLVRVHSLRFGLKTKAEACPELAQISISNLPYETTYDQSRPPRGPTAGSVRRLSVNIEPCERPTHHL